MKRRVKVYFRDAELLTLRNTPFDGRKCIWVPSKDEEVSYAPATIIGEGSKVGLYYCLSWKMLHSHSIPNSYSSSIFKPIKARHQKNLV